jgi:uncharacterized protein
MTSVRLAVYIQPRASRSEVAGTHDRLVKIRIAAPAVENAANRELIAFLARRLGIARTRVRIVAGRASRRKLVEIDGLSGAEIDAALAAST